MTQTDESMRVRRTERLLLRKPTPDDLAAVFEIHGDERTNQFNPAGAHADVEESRALLDVWLAHWDEHGFGYWAVCSVDDPARVLGFGGVRYKPYDGTPTLNLYFRFRPSAWGYGYATELAQDTLGFAFSELEESAVLASVRPDNSPSIRVLERSGFEFVERRWDMGGESLVFRVQAPASQTQ